MEELTHCMNRAARKMRRGDYADAAADLNHCIQRIQAALRDARLPQESVAQLAYSLETMLLMQQQGDWVGMADVIEHEFVGLWRRAAPTGDDGVSG